MTPLSMQSRRRLLTASLLAVVLLTGCGGDDEKKAAVDDKPFVPATATTPATAPTVPAGEVKTADGKTRKATFTDVRKAVDADRFDDAERALPALRPAQRVIVRKRIANRLAREAQAALRKGDRARVLNMLARAEKYPPTLLSKKVAADYAKAEKALAERDLEAQLARRQAARERRAKAQAERAAEIARKAQQQQP